MAVVTSTKPWSFAKDPEPVIEDGKELTQDDIRKRLARVQDKLANIETLVADIKEPEAQARAARDLCDDLSYEESGLERMLKDAIRWENAQLEQKGIHRYGTGSDDGDKAVTDMVKARTAWFYSELDKLKEEFEEHVQEDLDKLNAEGHATPVAVRDKIYESFVENEIIEAWEPLEF